MHICSDNYKMEYISYTCLYLKGKHKE